MQDAGWAAFQGAAIAQWDSLDACPARSSCGTWTLIRRGRSAFHVLISRTLVSN